MTRPVPAPVPSGGAAAPAASPAAAAPARAGSPAAAAATRVLGALLGGLAVLLACPAAAAAASWVWPVAGPQQVAHPFAPGPTRYSAGHYGADLPAADGTPVRAAGAGRVSYAGLLAGRGVVVVVHGELRTTYEPVAAEVRVGQLVSAGQQLGVVSGRHGSCPASCLHWGLRRGDTYLDPVRLVRPGPVRLLPVPGVGGLTPAPAPLRPAPPAAAPLGLHPRGLPPQVVAGPDLGQPDLGQPDVARPDPTQSDPTGREPLRGAGAPASPPPPAPAEGALQQVALVAGLVGLALLGRRLTYGSAAAGNPPTPSGATSGAKRTASV